jgi:hypothetical protein
MPITFFHIIFFLCATEDGVFLGTVLIFIYQYWIKKAEYLKYCGQNIMSFLVGKNRVLLDLEITRYTFAPREKGKFIFAKMKVWHVF